MKNSLALFGRLRERFEIFRYRRHIQDMLRHGLTIGKNVTIMPSVWIDYEYCFLISIGDNCSLSKGVRILAHDATTFKFTGGYTKIGKVVIKENCCLSENCIILPGVTIGPNVLVTAGSVVNKDIPPNSCVAGNPARFYCRFEDFIKRHEEKITGAEIMNHWTVLGDEELHKNLKEEVGRKDYYVKGFKGKFPWTWNER